MWEWSLLSCPILCMQDRAQKAFQPPNLLETLSCQVRYARPWRHLNLLCLHLHDCIFNIIHLSLSLLPSPPPTKKKKCIILFACVIIYIKFILRTMLVGSSKWGEIMRENRERKWKWWWRELFKIREREIKRKRQWEGCRERERKREWSLWRCLWREHFRKERMKFMWCFYVLY